MGKISIEQQKDGYIIKESNKGFMLCKILSTHKTQEEATKKMLEIMQANREKRHSCSWYNFKGYNGNPYSKNRLPF